MWTWERIRIFQNLHPCIKFRNLPSMQRGPHRYFGFGPAQCAVAVFADLEAMLCMLTIFPAWVGVERDDPALGEPAQRQVNMADHLASGPFVDHCRNAFQCAPVA